jgi:hypothetical protein
VTPTARTLVAAKFVAEANDRACAFMGAVSLDNGTAAVSLVLLVEFGAVVHEMEPPGVGAIVSLRMTAAIVGAKVPLRTAPVGA